MKYLMQVEVEADQFLPQEDKIPTGVISDGPRSPKTDKRSSWILFTNSGTNYLNDGDYVVTMPDGSKNNISAGVFEANYKLMEG